ncbi:hypothetical protein [Natronorubrum sp. A-ect3]|uniref:hypothetical protein n=1 Tax=Natronorubrum sp. A-ect3 TaxID=3242698 RepID=UPI00359DB6EF
MVITLRGYLVPGTPRLTERYFPSSLLRLFGKEPVSDHSLEMPTDDDPWHILVAAGVADRSPEDELVITDEFQEALHRETNRRSGTPSVDDVATIVDTTAIDPQGTRAFSIDGSRLLRWDSSAALLADVAAASILQEWVEWSTLERDDRLDALQRIRLLLEQCPSCGGAIDRHHDRVDPCCQPPHISMWTSCRECGAPIGDITVPESKADPWTVPLSRDEDVSTISDSHQ